MNLPKRKPTRLKDYDYSTPSAYFITICTKGRENVLSKINVGDDVLDVPKNKLTECGKIVEKEILNIEQHYSNIKVDKYIIMPNHVHMIIIISETEGINLFPTIKYDISNVIGKFKAAASRSVGNAFMHSEKKEMWQRSFHDHIIRGKEDYLKIWEYIDTNVQKWELDCFYKEEDVKKSRPQIKK